MIALTPDFSAMRLTQETEASSSRGLMVSISVTPIPRSTCSILIFWTISPMTVRPVPGCGWWPVMAVVELSRTTSTIFA